MEQSVEKVECLIIGSGPAGYTAAIYAARQKINFIVLTDNVGGQTLWSTEVENYLGFHLMYLYYLFT